jgi:putative transcriptional regulator
MDVASEITVLQLPKFKTEATELIGTDGNEMLAVYLIDNPDAGDVIPGSAGVRKLRWAAKGNRMSRKATAKKEATTFGEDLIEGMKVVLAHQKGKVELEQVWPKPIDVKAIRKRVKMSQAEFARAYGISKRALQEWEQGGRQPDSAARAYLTVIAKNPTVVRRALASE